LDSFSVELATGTCPQCTSALEWAFSEPAPAPADEAAKPEEQAAEQNDEPAAE